MSSLLKQSISSPLEAGTSILDTQSLPPHLTEALEYASKRLARKAMHITLIVVRREHQLPSSGISLTTTTSSRISSPASPEFSWSSGPLSPTRLASQGAAGLRHLVRRGTGGSVSSTSSSSSSASDASAPRSAVASPTFSSTPATPCTPATPYSATTCTSTSSSSSSSTSSSAASSAGGPNPWGARLIHATPLSPREEYHLRRAISKAERKFQTGTGFLAPASTSSSSSPWSSSSTCGLYSRDVVRRCVRQNEVLFASEGLTLLGLDRLYAFKSALAAYARTTLRGWRKQDREARLEDAVDELRRLVLSRRGNKTLERKELYACYEWIGVSAGALGDVERMYRRAYGGAQQTGAFDEAVMADITVHVEHNTHNNKAGDDVPLKLSVARTPSQPIVKIGKPPSPKAHTPVLKLKTSFDTTTIQKPAAIRPKTTNQQGPTELAIKIDVLPEEEEEDINTARPKDTPSFWSGIDEMLTTRPRHGDEQVAMSPVIQRLRVSSQQQQRLGPSTPNGYDDISPVTRGEWGFLFQGRGWTGGRTAAVETC